MKSIKKVRILDSSLVLFLFVLVLAASAQKGDTGVRKHGFDSSSISIVRDEGWVLPIFEEAVILKESMRSENGIELVVRSHRVLKDNEQQFEFFLFGENPTLRLKSTKVEPKSVSSVSSKGRTFLLLVSYNQIGSYEDEEGVSHKAYVGHLIQVGYLDDDGDGRFETRYNISKPDIRVPEWVKK